MNVTAELVSNAAMKVADDFNDIIGVDDVAERIETAIDAAFRMFAIRIIDQVNLLEGQVGAE